MSDPRATGKSYDTPNEYYSSQSDSDSDSEGGLSHADFLQEIVADFTMDEEEEQDQQIQQEQETPLPAPSESQLVEPPSLQRKTRFSRPTQEPTSSSTDPPPQSPKKKLTTKQPLKNPKTTATSSTIQEKQRKGHTPPQLHYRKLEPMTISHSSFTKTKPKRKMKKSQNPSRGQNRGRGRTTKEDEGSLKHNNTRKRSSFTNMMRSLSPFHKRNKQDAPSPVSTQHIRPSLTPVLINHTQSDASGDHYKHALYNQHVSTHGSALKPSMFSNNHSGSHESTQYLLPTNIPPPPPPRDSPPIRTLRVGSNPLPALSPLKVQKNYVKMFSSMSSTQDDAEDNTTNGKPSRIKMKLKRPGFQRRLRSIQKRKEQAPIPTTKQPTIPDKPTEGSNFFREFVAAYSKKDQVHTELDTNPPNKSTNFIYQTPPRILPEQSFESEPDEVRHPDESPIQEYELGGPFLSHYGTTCDPSFIASFDTNSPSEASDLWDLNDSMIEPKTSRDSPPSMPLNKSMASSTTLMRGNLALNGPEYPSEEEEDDEIVIDFTLNDVLPSDELEDPEMTPPRPVANLRNDSRSRSQEDRMTTELTQQIADLDELMMKESMELYLLNTQSSDSRVEVNDYPQPLRLGLKSSINAADDDDSETEVIFFDSSQPTQSGEDEPTNDYTFADDVNHSVPNQEVNHLLPHANSGPLSTIQESESVQEVEARDASNIAESIKPADPKIHIAPFSLSNLGLKSNSSESRLPSFEGRLGPVPFGQQSSTESSADDENESANGSTGSTTLAEMAKATMLYPQNTSISSNSGSHVYPNLSLEKSNSNPPVKVHLPPSKQVHDGAVQSRPSLSQSSTTVKVHLPPSFVSSQRHAEDSSHYPLESEKPAAALNNNQARPANHFKALSADSENHNHNGLSDADAKLKLPPSFVSSRRDAEGPIRYPSESIQPAAASTNDIRPADVETKSQLLHPAALRMQPFQRTKPTNGSEPATVVDASGRPLMEISFVNGDGHKQNNTLISEREEEAALTKKVVKASVSHIRDQIFDSILESPTNDEPTQRHNPSSAKGTPLQRRKQRSEQSLPKHSLDEGILASSNTRTTVSQITANEEHIRAEHGSYFYSPKTRSFRKISDDEDSCSVSVGLNSLMQQNADKDSVGTKGETKSTPSRSRATHKTSPSSSQMDSPLSRRYSRHERRRWNTMKKFVMDDCDIPTICHGFASSKRLTPPSIDIDDTPQQSPRQTLPKDFALRQINISHITSSFDGDGTHKPKPIKRFRLPRPVIHSRGHRHQALSDQQRGDSIKDDSTLVPCDAKQPPPTYHSMDLPSRKKNPKFWRLSLLRESPYRHLDAEPSVASSTSSSFTLMNDVLDGTHDNPPSLVQSSGSESDSSSKATALAQDKNNCQCVMLPSDDNESVMDHHHYSETSFRPKSKSSGTASSLLSTVKQGFQSFKSLWVSTQKTPYEYW